MPVAAGSESRPTDRCCIATAFYFFAWGAERACGLFGEGYRTGAEEENPVVPLGTWRWRISIIAGIKAGASFGHVPLSFLPGPFTHPALSFVLLLKVLFRHIIGTNACPREPVQVSTATTFVSLSCGLRTLPFLFSFAFSYLLPFYKRESVITDLYFYTIYKSVLISCLIE